MLACHIVPILCMYSYCIQDLKELLVGLQNFVLHCPFRTFYKPAQQAECNITDSKHMTLRQRPSSASRLSATNFAQGTITQWNLKLAAVRTSYCSNDFRSLRKRALLQVDSYRRAKRKCCRDPAVRELPNATEHH